MLREYQRRDSLMAQLLAEREQLRREAGRSAGDAARAEKQAADAQRVVARVKVRVFVQCSCWGVLKWAGLLRCARNAAC